MNAVGNGCGPAWLPRWVKRVLFDWFYEASCARHDLDYGRGGNEVDRFRADWRFWQAMRRDALRHGQPKRLLYWLTAVVFYGLVRLFGRWSFNYHD